MSFEAKVAASDAVLQRNFAHAAAVSAALEPAWHMPFAGSFVLGGGQWRKNACLGTTTADEAARHLEAANPEIPVLLLNEGQTIDLATGERSAPYEPIDRLAERAYIAEVLSAKPYPHEADAAPDPAALLDGCRAARDRLWDRQRQFDFFPDLAVSMAVGDAFFAFNFRDPGGEVVVAPTEGPEARIQVRMDERLLARIVAGTAHWNNAEGGCHIDFVREPDVYNRDFHTMMSFFAA
jgi:UDP-MurNAc hydroxylase